ncbi:phenoloxidase-activating factor 2 [Drosophila biarmipes]|uniref:phenoloxidase-activating factor 2 n=1 Tax=Drosophila biarmipes TaxID=125945 RepID=UPI0007E5E089|nr:phenoloxidase-activating factor 2 [Drosophila biarmipes]
MYSIWTLYIFLSVLISFGGAQEADYSQSIENEMDSTAEQPKCGEGSPIPLELDFNVTDAQAKPGEFPWTVAILHSDRFLCGGSLIAPDVVLTTAHWLYNKRAEDLTVSAGEWEYGNALEKYPFEEQNVTKMVIHKLFNLRTSANNLALLFLEEEFQMTYRINTICLPKEKRSLNSTRCLVAGWGKKEFKDKHNTSILKKVDLPLVPRDVCQDQLRKTRLGKSFTLPSGLICAGGEEGKDACTGDGGGALFCPMAKEPNRFEQIGIVNWGVGCNRKNVPATYTDVFEFKSWILNQTAGPVALPESN